MTSYKVNPETGQKVLFEDWLSDVKFCESMIEHGSDREAEECSQTLTDLLKYVREDALCNQSHLRRS